jgi:hypothetical protein
MDAHTKGLLLGLGLVALSLLAAIVANQIQTGGAWFSNLSRTVKFPLDKMNIDFQRQLFLKRLAALGFERAGSGDDFIQGGPQLMSVGAASHAATKKMLTLRFEDTEPDKAVAVIALHYLALVAVDSGEAAYRDAVLDYVTGRADEMRLVRAPNLLAMNSLIGGLLACAVAAVLVISDQLGLWVAIPTLGITELGTGLLALYFIGLKPKEISGAGKAVAGVLLSLAAICVSLYHIIVHHSSPLF